MQDILRQERKRTHLPGHDYSLDGTYFVTICINGRSNFFGDVVDKKMIINDSGIMIFDAWQEMPIFYEHVSTDIFQVMPNHFHGIASITSTTDIDDVFSLHDAIHRFKTLTTKRYVDGVKFRAWAPFENKLWQRGYNEHEIRNVSELNRIRKYIATNPANWEDDPFCNLII